MRGNAPAECANSCSGMKNRERMPRVESSQSRIARSAARRMENQVVQAIVAVHDRGFLAGRNVCGEPGDEMVHASIFPVSEAWYCLLSGDLARE